MTVTLNRRIVVAALAAAALPAAAAHAAPRTVTGTVFYRERIALPDDAVLTVRLGVMEASGLGDHLIAEQIVAPAGQVPIGFALQLDTADLPQDARIGLDAAIVSDGSILFRTREAVPLPATDGAPLEILLVNAGREPVAPQQPAIAGIEWLAVSVAGVADLGEARPTLTIGADGAAAGRTGCNRYFAKATIEGEALSFSQAGTTFMACADPAMRVERAFLDALTATAAYRLEGGFLLLLDGGGAELARFSAAA